MMDGTLIITLMLWAAALTGLPSADPPAVRWLPAEHVDALCNGGEPTPVGSAPILACYAYRAGPGLAEGTMLLPSNLDPDDPVLRSYVVHESVHHLQRVWHAEVGLRCLNELEPQAYEAQTAYLAAFGLDPAELGIYTPLGAYLAAMCPEDW